MTKRVKDAKRSTSAKIENIIDILLQNRGIKHKKDRAEFFNPTHPDKISGKDVGISEKELDKAVQRITKAVAQKEKIIVYGDYDADGICATAILWESLHFLGADAMPYIPSRFTEGYGLNKASIKELKEQNPTLGLIVTVDHGIVAHEQVEYARSLGMDVIVTDHHELGETIPAAYAVVHTTEISGSAVSWYLARGLDKAPEVDHLGLVALGTVADVLPLLGFNRSMVVHGLKVLRGTGRPGLKALCRQAGVAQGEINTFHIGFLLGPRINAMGRLEHAIESLRLLCTRDIKRAGNLALKLDQMNRLRQERTESTLGHVESTFGPAWSNGNLPKVLFIHHESYEEGIIGIVAGKLADKYYRPTVVVARGEEFSKASARSIQGVNIIDFLKKAGAGLFENIGGHQAAAGFTIRTDNLEILGQKIAEVSAEIKDEVLLRNTRVDCEIGFQDVDDSLYGFLARFAPFGYGNPEPNFLTQTVRVKEARLVGKTGEHIKLSLEKEEDLQVFSREAIAFRMGNLYPTLSGTLVNVVYSIERDDWQGNQRLQLKVRKLDVSSVQVSSDTFEKIG